MFNLGGIDHVHFLFYTILQAEFENGEAQMTIPWRDLVIQKLEELEKRDRDDEDTYQTLCSYLNDAASQRDGEKLQRDGKRRATKYYKDKPVFQFMVSDGEILVTPDNADTEHLSNLQGAVERMAELVALVVHRKLSASAQNVT